ncbi:MAG: hypothetical protein H7336_12075 [Bacteriovorax sp.]|nr:hypothetical protein [Bacteriovorax sp.]
MTKVAEKTAAPVNNHNLKSVKPFRGGHGKVPSEQSTKEIAKTAGEVPKADITEQAKALNAAEEVKAEAPAESAPSSSSSAKEVMTKASSVAKAISKVPILPIVTPSADSKALQVSEKKVTSDKKPEPPVHVIKKPAVIFIEGFSMFGISNGDGIKDMADNFPGAKKFDWTDNDKIVEEIKKHAPDQPVVLVGHSFGGDTAIEVANELNSPKQGFRAVDLLVSIDAVGMNKTIIPVNVKSNLNFFGEGMMPFIHGDPTVARNTKYTQVTNELRSLMHSKMDDNPEVQFEIFNKINDVLGNNKQEDELVIEIGDSQVKDIMEAILKHSGPQEA